MTEIDPKNSVQNEQFEKLEDTKETQNLKPSVEDLPKQDSIEESKEVSKENEAIADSNEPVVKTSENKLTDTVNGVTNTTNTSEIDKAKPDNEVVSDDKKFPEEVNYATKTKEELLGLLKLYLAEYPIKNIKRQVEGIKASFYKLHNTEIEEVKVKFIEEGGLEEDFKVEESPIEITVKELLNEYRIKRNELNKKLENDKEANLKAKYEIIETIKELINSQESLNKTFHDFRDLQDKWREIGAVPQGRVKDLWEKYHYHVEAFYDFIKINKELRDLDFKKNLESKLILCEKSEELLLETSVVEAFKQLQILHDQWREIGPVPSDKRNEIWDRFKEVTSKINHKHQEYFVTLKENQKKNLEEKTILCEKAEELAAIIPENSKDWEEKSKSLIELQKIWKTIGFAPKKSNNKIYERFRAGCDIFFNNKRDFYARNREEQENHLQLKTELCIQAEALAESTDWKKTTNELIRLQKRWKTIGAVPLKQSDKIWKRFRSACDTFFNNKSNYYATIDTTYKNNLQIKEDLLKEIEAFIPGKDDSESLNKLKEFQRKWSEIGYVPIKEKETIQEKYRAIVNAKFDALHLDDEHKSVLKFKNKLESISSKPNANNRLDMEREKAYNKLKQLENDIALWENNIGFFANSKNAESLIADVENKINDAKERIKTLKEKLNILDEFEK